MKTAYDVIIALSVARDNLQRLEDELRRATKEVDELDSTLAGIISANGPILRFRTLYKIDAYGKIVEQEVKEASDVKLEEEKTL